MRKVLKILGIGFVVLLLAILIYGFINHQELPKGTTGTAADALATQMLTALNYEAYQKTNYLEWSFRNGAHQYQWYKNKGFCHVFWDDIKVELNLN